MKAKLLRQEGSLYSFETVQTKGKEFQVTRAKELKRLLYLSTSYTDPNEGRSHISGLTHALRVSTLARRHDPANVEMAFVGLVHDLARPLSDIYHGEVIAEIVRDIVSERSYHILRTHGEYQDAVMHGRYPESNDPWFPNAEMLCAWELASFNEDIWDHTPCMKFKDARALIDFVCGTRQ